MIKRNIQNIYVGPDFLAQGEMVEGFLFLHCDVLIHSRDTLRKIKKMIDDFHGVAYREYGYDKPFFAYTQNPRWCKLIGGEYANSFEQDGRKFEVWVWELKSQLQ